MFGHWNNRSGIDNPDLNDYLGFIYMITFADGSRYVGKKKLWHTRYTYSKYSTGRRKRTKYYVESDWKTYKSSSNEVAAKLKDGQEAIFEILAFFKYARMLNFAETFAIIHARSYEEEHDLNWRMEKVQGPLGKDPHDLQQLQYLRDFYQ